jgi:hypothetical protein
VKGRQMGFQQRTMGRLSFWRIRDSFLRLIHPGHGKVIRRRSGGSDNRKATQAKLAIIPKSGITKWKLLAIADQAEDAAQSVQQERPEAEDKGTFI